MSKPEDLMGLMKFSHRTEWKEPFEKVLTAHFASALQAFEMEYEDIPDILDDQWSATLWGCAFEDFLTRTIPPDNRNIVDVYLKKRGFKESVKAKTYMKGLRNSSMTLYEIVDVEPGESLQLRGLIEEGDAILAHETSATQILKPGDLIAARLVAMRDRTVLAGGLLPFSERAVTLVMEGLADDEDLRDDEAADMPTAGEAQTHGNLAPLLTTIWLFDALSDTLNIMADIANSDGDEIVLHRIVYDLAKGVRQKTIIESIQSIGIFERSGRASWNWLEDESDRDARRDSDAAGTASPVSLSEATTGDGRLILGHLEIAARSLTLTTSSRPRAALVMAILEDRLGDCLTGPEITTEFLDDPDDDEVGKMD